MPAVTRAHIFIYLGLVLDESSAVYLIAGSFAWACCNLSAGVALNVKFTTNEMCAKNNTHIYVARSSSNRVIAVCDLLLLAATL